MITTFRNMVFCILRKEKRQTHERDFRLCRYSDGHKTGEECSAQDDGYYPACFFATLANADAWVEIEMFGKEHEAFLRNYLELQNGIPSHDTLQKVFAMVPSEFLESF